MEKISKANVVEKKEGQLDDGQSIESLASAQIRFYEDRLSVSEYDEAKKAHDRIRDHVSWRQAIGELKFTNLYRPRSR